MPIHDEPYINSFAIAPLTSFDVRDCRRFPESIVMSMTPDAPSMRLPQSLDIIEDLKKIKVEIEERGVVENSNNTSQIVPGETEHDLGEGEGAHECSSPSKLSEPEDSGSDTALTNVKHEGSHLGIDKPQERSVRTRNMAKAYIEPDSSSEDVEGRQRGRGTMVKNTWAVDLSQESEIYSTASYTSDSADDSVEERSTESEFSMGKGEDGSELEYDGPSERLDAVHPTERGKLARRLRSAAGRKKMSENRRISQAKLKYMINHGTLNDERSKPWEIIAKECGVTASLEHIFRALKRAGVSYNGRLGLKPQLPTNRDHDSLSVSRCSSPLSSTSSTHDDVSVTIKLTPREWELIVVACQSIKDGCDLEVRPDSRAMWDLDVTVWLLSRQLSADTFSSSITRS